jgi:hypothetical protein
MASVKTTYDYKGDSLGHYYGTKELCIYIEKSLGDNSWTKADALLVTTQSLKPTSGWYWQEDDGAYMVVSEATYPLPQKKVGRICESQTRIRFDNNWVKTFDLGRQAFIEVQLLEVDERAPTWQRQMETLKALKERKLSFKVPEILCHGNVGQLHYWVYTRVGGVRLRHVWPFIEDTATKDAVIKRLVSAHMELATWRSDCIGAVGGHDPLDPSLDDISEDRATQRSLQSHRRNAEAMGYDCSEIVFAHNHADPDTFIFNPVTLSFVGMIHFGSAGFVPKDHVVAMQRVQPDVVKYHGWDPSGKMVLDWAKRMTEEMVKQGFDASAPNKWWRWAWANAAVRQAKQKELAKQEEQPQQTEQPQ